MIVDESSALRAALDRRLLIDRLLAIDPLRPLIDPADAPRQEARRQGTRDDDDGSAASPRLSADALRLQTIAQPADEGAAPHQGTRLRFEVPLLASDSKAPDESKPAPLGVTFEAETARDPTTSTLRHAGAAPETPPLSLPLVLQGPAWNGQAIELIVRRERADEMLDNPALDQWCGEVVIDLPELGRVAGHLSFSMQGLRVRLEADEVTSVASLTAATAELAVALAGIDLRVVGLSVGRPAADAMRSAAPASLNAVFTGGDRGPG